MTIRVATLEDVPTMLQMGQRFLTGTRYRRFLNLNPQQQTQLVTELVQQDTSEVFLAEDTQIAGMLGLTLSHNPFDGVKTAMEMFWWVEPNRRGTVTAKQLLRTAEAWAKAAGAERLLMVVPEPAVGHYLEKLGYDYVESIYQRLL